MSGRRVMVRGVPAYVGDGGGGPRADAPCLVFVHGAGMDHTVWALPARHFARKGFRVFAPDLPGHGRSEGPPLASVVELSDWLAALLDVCDVERAGVAGHSMGSLVAWMFAARRPARCAALALLGTSAPMPVAPPLLRAAADNHHAAIDMANTWSHSAAGLMGAGENPGIWMPVAGQRLLERAGAGVLHEDLAACDGFRAPTDEVDCPTLVVVGEADRMTPPRAGQAVAESLANARVARLPGCGHAMLSERPNAVLDALISIFAPADARF